MPLRGDRLKLTTTLREPSARSGTPFGRPLRYRIQAMKNYADICRGRRGRPGQGGPLRDLAIAYSSIMAGFCEPRTTSHGFSSDSDAATRRQTQTDNDASGNPQHVAGRPLGVPYGCGVPPRQTQTDNDASGNPQRVAGRPLGVPYGIAARRCGFSYRFLINFHD